MIRSKPGADVFGSDFQAPNDSDVAITNELFGRINNSDHAPDGSGPGRVPKQITVAKKSNRLVIGQRVQGDLLSDRKVESGPLNAFLGHHQRSIRSGIFRRLPSLNVGSDDAEARPSPA